MRGKDSQQNELFDAARRGDIERLNLWLNSKKNHRPRTPLNFLRSVQGGPRPPTSWLFSLRDASNGYTALHLAALHGHADAVLTLIEADASLLTARDRRGCLPLHLAAWNGHLPAVEALLNADRSTVDIVNNAKESSLHFASQHGHAKVVSALLQRQADAKALNARGETALDLAARFGRANVVRLLVSNCPELALQSAVECVDSSSVYPLHSAARNGHIDCLAILIDSGFDVDFVTDQGTALHVAALFGKVAIVKLLLEKDISVDIRDGQGRTVLEVLDQHENEKATDLTQMMQSRDAWSECRKLIQGHIASKQQQQLNVAVYANGEETPEKLTPNQNGGSQYQNVSSVSPNRDVIWRPLPEAVANRLATTAPRSPNRSKGDHHQSASGDRYHPPSMQAELVHMNVGDDMNDNASTISLSTLRETMSSRGSGLTSPVGRFPTRPLDGDGNRPANRATINGPPCSYQAPATYDAWEPPAKRYDNLAGTTTHPHLAYDNVPSNLLVYDNAPPPGHRRWEHDCHHDHNSAPDCKHPKRERTSSDTTAIELNKLSIAVGDLNHHDATKSDSASPQRRPGSRASVVTFACSTLERSITPNHSDSPPTPTGRAPLALPEELGGSTTTSIVSSNASPSRWSTPGPPGLSRHSLNDSYDRRSTSTVDQTSDHVTIISTSTSTPDAPPPPAWTSESRIFDTLYSNDSLRHSSERSVSPDLLTHISREQETQAELLSPISTDCSECAGSPSASMSVGGSPTKRSIVERQYSTEQRSDASIEVKMRPASRRTSTDDATAGLNESAEWQKINDIMESFGGAICRESIFADRFEPQVAVYLRDRRSHALTLQLNKATIVEDDDPLASPLLTQVAEWLRLTVALPDWAPVAHLLDSHGYDRLQFLRSTLNQRTLRDLGVGKEAQSKIFAALQSTPSAVPSAHDFTYVSDWLLALDLEDHLGRFMKAGYGSMAKVCANKWTVESLKQLGIDLPGHSTRIVASLATASSQGADDSALGEDDLEATAGSVTRTESKDWRHEPSTLITDCLSYSAHYLGSMEIANVESTQDSRRAMVKLKKGIREIAKIPQVMLEISVTGVRVLDAQSKLLTSEHQINRIQCVCQDERDLNCFAYISQDGGKHFCHVFCVLTGDVATEIILTLGQAFEVAFRLATAQGSARNNRIM